MAVGLDEATVENVLHSGLLYSSVIGCGKRLAPWGGRAGGWSVAPAACGHDGVGAAADAGVVTSERAAAPG
jgi:hypothetical protein